jgi:hypothetical protein
LAPAHDRPAIGKDDDRGLGVTYDAGPFVSKNSISAGVLFCKISTLLITPSVTSYSFGLVQRHGLAAADRLTSR